MRIKIGKLYELAEEFYKGIDNIPKNCMKVQNEKLLDLHKKKDSVIKIELSNGITILPAGNHVLYKNNKEVFAKDIKIGDELADNVNVISAQKIKDNADVYDISVNNETCTYILGGIKHHNTGSKRIQNLFRTILNGYLGDCWNPRQEIEFNGNKDFMRFIENG